MSTKTANIEKSTIDEVDSEESPQSSAYPEWTDSARDPSVYYASNAQLDICDVVNLIQDQDEDEPRLGVVMGLYHGPYVPEALCILWPDGSISKHFPEHLKKVGPIDR